jgi:hypothetical protein
MGDGGVDLGVARAPVPGQQRGGGQQPLWQ